LSLKAKQTSACVAPSTDVQRSVLVWDAVVRICHLALIAGVLGAWLTRHWPGTWHELLGYGVALTVLLRCIWGVIGTQSARFRSFVLGPRAALRYLRQLLAHKPRRYLGHNPLGALMIVAMLLNLTLISVTGWMFTTDRFFGYAWVIDTHLYASYALFAMVALHLLGVAHASISHGENLVASMIHGRKRACCESGGGENGLTAKKY
jgi:cytochrome b